MLEALSPRRYIAQAAGVLETPATALTEAAMKPQPTAEGDIARQMLTIKLRLRDRHASELNRMARAVNFVWNFCNETQQKAARAHRKWLSAFDLSRLTAGASKELNIHAHTIQRICSTYDQSRRTHKKAWLRWRGHKSLGWVPFNTGHITFDGETFKFRGVAYETMHVHPRLAAAVKIGAGSFNQDARGRWYINAPIEVKCAEGSNLPAVGVDLGLHDMATLSDGTKIKAPRLYRASEAKLATAQRAKKTPKRVRSIHAKIANRRKDFLHKASAGLASKFGLLVVGDVSSKKLAKTTMAKSVLDAGWSSFKTMLLYKSHLRGGNAIEVSERYSTQICSCCGCNPVSSPKGRVDLDKRNWVCSECGAEHDRDRNAALNILRCGLATLGGAHV